MWALLLSLVAEPALAAAELEYVPRIWEPPASFPAILRDVAGRLPPDSDARETDLITWTHEGTHFLSKGKPGYHGVYVGNGLRWYVPTPPITTAAVFAAIPADERGSIYDTYLRQGQSEYWQSQPLMILDEWNAYLSGSTARNQLTVANRKETTVHCATLAAWAATLYRMAKDVPEYPITELKTFCDWQLDRCRGAIPDWDQLTGARFD